MSDHSTPSPTPPVLDAVPSGRWRWPWVALGLVLLAALVPLFWFNPADHAFYPFCAFHRLTGLQCPGCGGFRAVHHLLHGEVVTALRFNPLVVFASFFAVGFGVRRWIYGAPVRPASHRVQARRAWIVFGVLLVFWVVRNLPIDCFRLPAG